MRMESEKSPNVKINGACSIQDVRRNGNIVKSLGIQRCNSDGVLIESGLVGVPDLITGRSSSESSITDSSPELSTSSGCNALSETNGENSKCSKIVEELDLTCHDLTAALASSRDNAGTSSLKLENCDVVRPKTWSRRAVEKKKTHKNHRKSTRYRCNSNVENGNCANLCSPVSDYTRNVCDVYRQENDLLLGRTRGGTLTNNKPAILVCPMSKYVNGGSEFHESLSRDPIHISGTSKGASSSLNNGKCAANSFPDVVAPLAVAENLSDEEFLSDFDPENYNFSIAENGNTEDLSKITSTCSSPEIASQPELTIDLSSPENSANNMASALGQGANHVGLVIENHRRSHSSSLESLDDIGDFIEADLPPNINRFAFYARGSSTEEDEGCCDEMPANCNNDEESENETIDPLTSDASKSWPASSNSNKITNVNGASNVLSSLDLSQREEKVKKVTNNIMCVENPADSNNVNLDFLDFEEDDEDEDDGFMCRSNGVDSSQSLLEKTASVGQASNGASVGQDTCVSCDKPVDSGFQRLAEFGVIVCDRCYNEHNSVTTIGWGGQQRDEAGARKKSRSSSNSLGNSKVLQRNGGFSVIFPRNLSHEKMNNNHSSGVLRLSSSDSDAFERLYISDSSEMVSPDAEQNTESSVFHTDSERTSGQINQSPQDEKGREESRPAKPVPRHSASLEYSAAEGVLYCPFYTRRSRSLDQDLVSDTSIDRSELDTRNILVSSSNFQEDKSNNQEKVFEKNAYTSHDPCCSSSDEGDEENTRVPSDEPDSFMVKQSASPRSLADSDSMEMLFVLATQRPRREEEPIYEDIEGLERLMGSALSDSENEGRPSTTQPLCNAISKLRRKKHYRSSPVSDIEKVMIWNEYEAYVVQVKQIGISACGPTAVLNVLKAFDFQVDTEEVCRTILANLRMEAAPIPYYLFSRYSAGTTAQALVDGVATVTRGTIKGRFFHFYPQRDVELLKWLGHWMKKGAVPVATLNLQRGVKPGWTIPDAWHHQMVYGVSSKGVHLTNPLEIVQENVILDQLTSDSVLLVRRHDVVSRFKEWCPLNELLKQPDPRWRTMNVLGQIVHMLREQCMPSEQPASNKSLLTSHISIPAVYKAGIILFVRSNTDVYQELMQTSELPVKETPATTTTTSPATAAYVNY